MTEQQIQTKIQKKLTDDGYYLIKLIKTNKNGIPDLLAIKNGKCLFVEVKTEKGKLAPLQSFRLEELKKTGASVKVWTDYNIDFNE